MITQEKIESFVLTPQYLAGLFDGEGSIGVYGLSNGKKSLRLQVTIVQKDPTILALIAMKFNKCRIYESDRKSHSYSLEYRGEDARDILDYIKDYCIIKYSQIILALQYLSISSMHHEWNNKLKIAEELRQEKKYTHLN